MMIIPGTNRLSLKAGVWLFSIAIILLLSSFSAAFASSTPDARPPAQNSNLESINSLLLEQTPRVYLPFVASGESGIYGYVTLLSNPVKDVLVDLWKEDGSTPNPVTSKVASTITNLSGYFSFANAAALSPNEVYRVRFDNPTPPVYSNTLSHWKTVAIPYTLSGQKKHIGDFDIGDAALGNPPDGFNTGTPVTFNWTRRPQSPTDSYEIRILTYAGQVEKYLTPPLGFVNNYTMNSLPGNLNINIMYTWYILISLPDGSIGTSSSQHRITFTQ
jgi:hypothetical protein